MMRFAKIVGILLVIAVVIAFIIPGQYNIYREREIAKDAYRTGIAVTAEVGKFYAEHKRLPNSKEADKFRREGASSFNSAMYDADKKMIVVTSLFDRRFTLSTVEDRGSIYWVCRTIDIPVADLPLDCSTAGGNEKNRPEPAQQETK